MTAVLSSSAVLPPHLTDRHNQPDPVSGGWEHYRKLDRKLKQSSGSLVLESETDDDYSDSEYNEMSEDTATNTEGCEQADAGEGQVRQPPLYGSGSSASVSCSHSHMEQAPSAAGARKKIKIKKRLHYVPFSLQMDPTYAASSSQADAGADIVEEGPFYTPMCLDGIENMSLEEVRAYLAHTRAEMTKVSEELVDLLLLNDRLTNENEALNASTQQVSRTLLSDIPEGRRLNKARSMYSLTGVKSALWGGRSKRRSKKSGAGAHESHNTNPCLEETASDVRAVPKSVSYTEGQK
eukprot:comp26449_c0_seq1/m.47105 comp26449_c0_seq1/g.47105  ORF comp26449_c0_seq1/g.47105 comp26449_c0_seq1/m.47105 type:complete len:294 (-) comp26449_c0_seq1:303-1184(-)